jgi:hypothetical protein
MVPVVTRCGPNSSRYFQPSHPEIKNSTLLKKRKKNLVSNLNEEVMWKRLGKIKISQAWKKSGWLMNVLTENPFVSKRNLRNFFRELQKKKSETGCNISQGRCFDQRKLQMRAGLSPPSNEEQIPCCSVHHSLFFLTGVGWGQWNNWKTPGLKVQFPDAIKDFGEGVLVR